jgi:prepilin-type N-terminal cleavage/methylation domain-containing protein
MFGRGKGAERSNRDSQRGFTLVEMAIVLAIIGLIVGGVIKGQELINGARLKSQVAQIDTIKAAIVTFQDKYGYLPGDYTGDTPFGTVGVTTDGDENGAIAHGGASVADTAHWDAEGQIALLQLNASGLSGGATPVAAVATPPVAVPLATATAAMMAGKLANTWLVLQTFLSNGQTAPMVRIQTILPSTTPTAAGATSLKATDAQLLDTKYDDGAPGSGAILVPSYATNCVTSGNAAGAYTTTATNVCDLLWVTN